MTADTYVAGNVETHATGNEDLVGIIKCAATALVAVAQPMLRNLLEKWEEPPPVGLPDFLEDTWAAASVLVAECFPGLAASTAECACVTEQLLAERMGLA